MTPPALTASMTSPELEQAATRAHDAIDRALRASEQSAGPCTSCRWGQEEDVEEIYRLCRNPVVAPPDFDAEHGRAIQRDVAAYHARRTGGICGPEGRLFETISAPDRIGAAMRNPFVVASLIIAAVALMAALVVWIR